MLYSITEDSMLPLEKKKRHHFFSPRGNYKGHTRGTKEVDGELTSH